MHTQIFALKCEHYRIAIIVIARRLAVATAVAIQPHGIHTPCIRRMPNPRSQSRKPRRIPGQTQVSGFGAVSSTPDP